MPRRSQGPHLKLRRARYDAAGNLTHHSVWIIRDGQHRESTGCGADDRRGAIEKLNEYNNRTHLKKAHSGVRDPAVIPVADVLALYLQDVAPKTARPKETTRRIMALLKFFGSKMLSEINGELCRGYVTHRVRVQSARKELEDLRAAINHHRREGKCNAIVEVALPEKAHPRERWLTRSEAAKLIWHCWRYRELQKGVPTDKRPRRHIAKFILAAIYTCTRKTAVCTAALEPAIDRPFVDLDRGIFYRRALGARRTKKRQPPVRVPDRLLAHMRRWHKNGQRYVVEWDCGPVLNCKKSFAAACMAVGLKSVIPHTLRHTGITWLAQEGTDVNEIIQCAGITMKVFQDVYWHHHPDFLDGVREGFSRHRNRHPNRHPNAATKREH